MQVVSLVGLGNICPSSDNRSKSTFQESARVIPDESLTVGSCLRAEKSLSILMKAEGLGSDWTGPEITRLPSRQLCCSDTKWRKKKKKKEVNR